MRATTATVSDRAPAPADGDKASGAFLRSERTRPNAYSGIQ